MDGKEEVEDRISSLPDCLLLEIISRLPTTKHAIKTTSTLSKRWQHLWTLLPNLIFLASKDVNKKVYCYDHHVVDGYFSFINKTLNQCPTHVNLNKFELLMRSFDSDFNTRHKSQINSWIRYAITRNIQEVDIELWDNVDRFRYDDDCFFKNLCATQMKLTRCVFINPISAISWEKLKWLCISEGILDEDVIAVISSGSPCLETLELYNCYGFKAINITSKSVKNLVLSNYGCNESGKYYRDSIEINAPYILSLRIGYNMDLRELLLLNVSSLVKADLDYWSHLSLFGLNDEEEKKELLKGLLQSLDHVKNFTLTDSVLKIFEFADDSD